MSGHLAKLVSTVYMKGLLGVVYLNIFNVFYIMVNPANPAYIEFVFFPKEISCSVILLV